MIKKRKTGNVIKYRAAVYIGTDADGKKQYKYGKTRDKRKDAVADEAELLKRLKNSRDFDMPFDDITFGELVDRFRESRDYTKLTPRTQDDYEYYLDKILLPVLGEMKIRTIRHRHVQSLVDSMESEMGWSPATVRKPFNQLKNILSFGIKNEFIDFNPCSEVDLPKMVNKRYESDQPMTWTPEQIQKFLTWEPVVKSKYYAMLLISFTCAARPGEVCGLTKDSIDGEYLVLSSGLDNKGRKTNLKNDYSHRRVYAGAKVMKAIHYNQIWQMECRLVFGDKYVHDHHLFRHENGSAIRPDVYAKGFTKLLKAYNAEHVPLPVIPLYKARTSWATNARGEYELDPEVIAAVMGHSTVKTSFENYIKVTPERLKESAIEVI